MAYQDEGLELYEYYKPIVTGTPSGSTYVTEKEQYTQIRRVYTVRQRAEDVKARAIELKQEGRHVEAGLYASGYMGLSVLEGVGQTIAAPVRILKDPIGALAGLGYAATHIREVVGLTAVALGEDPVRVVGQVGGGILVGAVASDVVAKIRGPQVTETIIKTRRVSKRSLKGLRYKYKRGPTKTGVGLKAKQVVVHTDDFLGSHQVQTGGAWPKSGRTGLGKPHYVQTGEGLTQMVPRSGGVEQTVYEITKIRSPSRFRSMYQRPTISHVTRVVTQTIPRSPTIVGPMVGGALGTFTPVKPSPPIQTPRRVQDQIQTQGKRAKSMTEQAIVHGPATRSKITPALVLPGYTPMPQKIVPISRTQITPALIAPGYTQKLTPITVQTQNVRQAVIPVSRTVSKTQKTSRAPPSPYIPYMRHISLTTPPPGGRRRPRKKRMVFDPLKVNIFGEFREYPVKTPEMVLRGLRI